MIKVHTTSDYLLEPLLTKFFLLESVCAPFLGADGIRDTFGRLSEVFCVSQTDDVDGIYAQTQLPHFKNITDFGSYERFCRVAEFARDGGQDIDISETDRVILSQKREAMLIRCDIFKQCKNLTGESIATTLRNAASNGYVNAMTMLAFMEYHGICMPKDRKHAIGKIRLCAKWNDLFGNLMGIAYDKENEKRYYDTLFTILRSEGEKEAFEHIRCFGGYTQECKKDPIARIVDKAFSLGIIKRETYDQLFSKVAYSPIVSVEDKEKLLLNKQKDAIVSLSEMPFDVKSTGKFTYDEQRMENLPLKREGEMRQIMKNLAVAHRCPRDVYMPLLIISADEYVGDMYAEALLDSIGKERVVEVDAGTLEAHDFALGKENVLLRGMSETKDANTVFFIKDCESLDGEVLEQVCKVLDHEYRKKYRMITPPVSIDISSVGFVLFANEHNASVSDLSELCDTVKTDKISAGEKSTVIASIFERKRTAFDYCGITMDAECTEFLESYSTKQIEQIIDAALRSAIFDRSDKITLTELRSICKDHSISSHRRGFGYTGGIYNA